MAQVLFSNVAYMGTAPVQSIFDYAANLAETISLYRKLGLNTLASYVARVITDGGVIVDYESLISTDTFISSNAVDLALVNAVSASWGVKLDVNGKITKLYNIGAENRDFAVRVGTSATVSTADGFSTLALANDTYFSTSSSLAFGEEFIFGGSAQHTPSTPIIASSTNALLASSAENSDYLFESQGMFRPDALPGVGGSQSNNPSPVNFGGVACRLRLDNYADFYSNGTVYTSATNVATRNFSTPRHLAIGAMSLVGGPILTNQPTRLAESWFIKSNSDVLAISLSQYLHTKYVG